MIIIIKKHIRLIFVLISIFSLITAFNLMIKEQLVLNINSRNRENFINAIKDDKIDNVNSITKVALGQGWHSGELYIYYKFGKVKEITISEGNFDYVNLEKYVREDGYSLDNIANVYLVVSILSLIIAIILNKIIFTHISKSSSLNFLS